MSGEICRATWQGAAFNDKATALDEAFPGGLCETWSLKSDDYTGIDRREMLARVLTSPGMYTAGEILTAKLTSANSSGVSLIRCGASDDEIRSTIDCLMTKGAEPQELLGAVVFSALDLRRVGEPEEHFSVYHTPDSDKTHHADILARTPAGSKSAVKKIERDRRYSLRDFMAQNIIQADSVDLLLPLLRRAGI
ncbi:hypothetical protein [Brevundimonas sp.]|uniref:hypothetical protein n=1 Tax=Brevundimonas sp. TaxID=1871086 RepID=UPI0028A043AD|nr:hypothetical protein [Brevundimonas sp.]